LRKQLCLLLLVKEKANIVCLGLYLLKLDCISGCEIHERDIHLILSILRIILSSWTILALSTDSHRSTIRRNVVVMGSVIEVCCR
jgi:hypothetical protein